jgi:hypothetical protein
MVTLVKDTGQFDNVTPQAQNTAGVTPDMLTGEDFLATVKPEYRMMIKKFASGEIPISPRLASSAKGIGLLEAVSQYDPSFDVSNYNARNATRRDYTPAGKTGQNITSIETLMHHLNTLDKDYQQLDNTRWHKINDIKNTISADWLGNAKTQGALKSIDQDANAVAGEMAKAFRSTGMSEADIQAWRRNFTTNMTPAEQKASVAKAIELVSGRLNPLVSNYNNTMNANKGIENFIADPEALAIYKKSMGITEPQNQPEAQPQAQPTVTKSRSGRDIFLNANGQWEYR